MTPAEINQRHRLITRVDGHLGDSVTGLWARCTCGHEYGNRVRALEEEPAADVKRRLMAEVIGAHEEHRAMAAWQAEFEEAEGAEEDRALDALEIGGAAGRHLWSPLPASAPRRRRPVAARTHDATRDVALTVVGALLCGLAALNLIQAMLP